MKRRLKDIDRKVDYKAPEGYFENLPLKIRRRIEAEKKEENAIHLSAWSYAIAASMLLILSIVFIFKDSTLPTESLLSEVSEEAIIAYLEEIDLDEYDIAYALFEEQEDLQFDDMDMLNHLDIGDGSFDKILQEYNLEEDSLEI